MAIDINACWIEGRLGADPETRIMSGGTKTVSVRIAVNDDYKDRNEQWKKRTYWITIAAYGRVAQELELYRKGDRVIVFGKWTVEEYTKDSKKQFFNKLNIHTIRGTDRRFPEREADSTSPRQERTPPTRGDYEGPQHGYGVGRGGPTGSDAEFDDDIPF